MYMGSCALHNKYIVFKHVSFVTYVRHFFGDILWSVSQISVILEFGLLWLLVVFKLLWFCVGNAILNDIFSVLKCTFYKYLKSNSRFYTCKMNKSLNFCIL